MYYAGRIFFPGINQLFYIKGDTNRSIKMISGISIFSLLLAHLRVLRSKGIKLLLQGGIQRKHAVCSVLAGVDHGFQLKHCHRARQNLPSSIPCPPRCPASGAACWCSTPSQHGRNRTSGHTSLREYSARDCAARPLKLSIHSGGIEHTCRRR